MHKFLFYLLEVVICQAAFCLLYLAVFRNLSFFQLNRFYLLGATLLSFIIPFISIPFWQANQAVASLNLSQSLQNLSSLNETSAVASGQASFFNIEWIVYCIFLIYSIGFTWRLFRLIRGIAKLIRLMRNNEVNDFDGVKTIQITSGPSFFAFLNYIFINQQAFTLSSSEFEQVIRHEKSHISQKHTLDNLFMELTMVFCWFNPLLRTMKRELNNVHEFYADQQATTSVGDVTSYSSLILKLSSSKDDNIAFLGHQFSMNNIKTRIIMMNKQKNPKTIVLKYSAIVPCLALLLVMFSFTKKSPVNTQGFEENEQAQIIGTISWNGNSLYKDSYLNEFFGLKTREKFNEKDINQKLNYQTDGSDLSSLYMDQGYLFFTVELKKEVNNKKVDLTFEITEGQVMKIGKVIVKGNKEVATERILKMIELKPGDLFSRSKLISSQRNIIGSGSFEPEKVIPTPIPHPEAGTVDIRFEVSEL